MLGVGGLGLWATALSGGSWSSAQLDAYMASLSAGVFFDFTKTDRHFQESIGPTLGDDVGEAIGLALDQRTWGGQTLAQVLAGAAQLVTNGDFSNGLTGWTFAGTANTASVVGGVLQLPPGESRIQAVPVAVGGIYEVTLSPITTASTYLGTSGNGNQYAATMGGIGGINGFRRIIKATTTSLYISMQSDVGAGTVRVADDVTVKRIPGDAGIQSTNNMRGLRQANGLKYDGGDDNHLMSYLSTNGPNFMVGLVDVPAVIAATQIVCGAVGPAGGNPVRLGVGVNGLVRAGLGATSVIEGMTDVRGTLAVIGFSFDGTTERLFANDRMEQTALQTAAPTLTVPFRMGAANNDGVAANWFGGSIKKLVMGRDFLTLSRYLQIRNALLAS